MDRLEFYKKQYAFLMGQIDLAIEELDHHNHLHARQTLVYALATAEGRWLDAFLEDHYENDPNTF